MDTLKTKLNICTLAVPLGMFFVCLLDCNSGQSTWTSILLPVKVDGKWGFADETWKIVIPAQYDSCSMFSYNRAMVKNDSGFNYISSSGEIMCKTWFLSARPFFSGLALVADDIGPIENRHEYFIDTFCNIRLYRYSDQYGYTAEDFSDNLIFASYEDSNLVFLDRNGKIAIKTNYKYTDGFREGVASLWSEQGEIVTINTEGKAIFKNNPYQLSCGLIASKDNDSTIFYDINNKIVLIPDIPRYNYNYFVEGFCSFSSLENKKLKHGFINAQGKVICPPIYDNVYPFQNGYAAVRLNEKWGFIDKRGKLIISLEFDAVFNTGFVGKFARVNKGKKTGYIDKKGKMVWIDT